MLSYNDPKENCLVSRLLKDVIKADYTISLVNTPPESRRPTNTWVSHVQHLDEARRWRDNGQYDTQ